jgi:adenine-specific DNA-methyltransferase
MNKIFITNKTPADKTKLRGGYYTPSALADYLVNWAIRDGSERILEPSCGDGNFLVAAAQRLHELSRQGKPIAAQISAVEIDPDEISLAKSRVDSLPTVPQAKYSWNRSDFFEIYPALKEGEKFDVVIGNPPFIRFQNFDAESRDKAFLSLREAGYKPTKLANAWAGFIQLAIQLLKDNGRLAMVVPAEIMQVQYAAELRNRITGVFQHIVLIGFKKLVFPEIQQEVVLLLAEGKRPWCGRESDIHTLEIDDETELRTQTHLYDTVRHCPAKHSRPGMKWTSLFLDNNAFEMLDRAQAIKELTPLGHLAEVDVGIVTGRNSFFVLDQATVGKLAAEPYCQPLVGRTGALSSILFRDDDFGKYKQGNPAYLLNLNGIPESGMPRKIKAYIKAAEEQGVNQGYKCRIRKRWYDVPSIYNPDAFLYRQIHSHPLLVVNDVGATCTDTIHRVRIKRAIDPKLLAASSLNSLTLAWAEVCGRSYGGGVLELEPREAEELPIPYFPNAKIDPLAVDEILRERNVSEALDYVDRTLLQGEMGMSRKEIRDIRNAWITLRDRRMQRRAN